MNEPEVILEMLGRPPVQPRTIAVIGLSHNPDKPSNFVPAYMQKHGYRILPVNPLVDTVLGERSYAALSDLPVKPDVRYVPIDEARHKMGAFADALALDQVVRSPRARALGWTPTLHSVAGNAARLLEEWRASRN